MPQMTQVMRRHFCEMLEDFTQNMMANIHATANSSQKYHTNVIFHPFSRYFLGDDLIAYELLRLNLASSLHKLQRK